MSRRDRILAALDPTTPVRLPLPASPRPALNGDPRHVFEQNARDAKADVLVLDTMASVPTWVLEHHPQGQLSVAPGLKHLDWTALGRRLSFGATDGDKALAVSLAGCGIAEIGALAMNSGPQTPTTLNFLPDREIVVLEARNIVPHLEDAWTRLRQSDAFLPPRALNLITGPSRTADIEQTIQLGAHGPRSLMILIVNGA